MTRLSHRQRIHTDLRARLLRGDIGPHVRLVDHVIAAELGVSRMPVREALMQLASEGYLEGTSRGFCLPDLPPDRIEQIFVLRRLLEPHAAALAATARSPAQLEAMRAAHDQLGMAQADIDSFHRAAEAFRNAWLSAVPNDALRDAIQRYSAQVQQVRFATMSDPAARMAIRQGIAALLAAFDARDALAAADQMQRFVFQAQDSFASLSPSSFGNRRNR